MTKTEHIEQLISDNGIKLYNFAMKNLKAFSLPGKIIVDHFNIDSDMEYRIALTEELGHCNYDAFYPLEICFDKLQEFRIAKAERRAKDYAILKLVPLTNLKFALQNCDSDYAAAEILDITVTFLRESVEFYERKNLI